MTQAQATQLINLVTQQNAYVMYVVAILVCIVGIKVLTWLLRW